MFRKLYPFLLFSILLYGGFVYFFGLENIVANLKNFSLSNIAFALFFVILGMFFEFLRWNFYMGKLGISLGVFKNLSVFLSGFAFMFLPSQSGQLVRYYLLKKEKVPLSKSIPIHFVSNFTDFIVVLLCATPILFILGKQKIFFIVFAVLLLIYISFKKPLLYLKLLRIIEKRTKLRFIQHFEKALTSSKKLLNTKILTVSFVFTSLQHLSLVVVLFFLLKDTINISFLLVFSIISLSLIMGAISMIPGGVGIVEGGSIALLSLFIDPVFATTIVLIMRFLTLWIPCFIGLFFLIMISSEKINFKKREYLKFE